MFKVDGIEGVEVDDEDIAESKKGKGGQKGGQKGGVSWCCAKGTRRNGMVCIKGTWNRENNLRERKIGGISWCGGVKDVTLQRESTGVERFELLATT